MPERQTQILKYESVTICRVRFLGAPTRNEQLKLCCMGMGEYAKPSLWLRVCRTGLIMSDMSVVPSTYIVSVMV